MHFSSYRIGHKLVATVVSRHVYEISHVERDSNKNLIASHAIYLSTQRVYKKNKITAMGDDRR